jgi:hypothetical protein
MWYTFDAVFSQTTVSAGQCALAEASSLNRLEVGAVAVEAIGGFVVLMFAEGIGVAELVEGAWATATLVSSELIRVTTAIRIISNLRKINPDTVACVNQECESPNGLCAILFSSTCHPDDLRQTSVCRPSGRCWQVHVWWMPMLSGATINCV